jgi:hypothetical protein
MPQGNPFSQASSAYRGYALNNLNENRDYEAGSRIEKQEGTIDDYYYEE